MRLADLSDHELQAELARRRTLTVSGSTALLVLREVVPALTIMFAVVVLGGVVTVPVLTATGTIVGTTADVATAVVYGMLAGGLAVFLLAARASATALHELQAELDDLQALDTFRRCRLLEVRAIATELADLPLLRHTPGAPHGVPQHTQALRTLQAVARDGIAGRVILDDVDPHGDAGARTAARWVPADAPPDEWPTP